MRQPRIVAAIAALSAVFACAAGPLHSASFEGRNIDGHWYAGTAANNTYGTYRNVQIEFNGERAYIKLRGGLQIVCILEEEAITDPHEIICYDPLRGVTWTLDVTDFVR